MFIAIVGMNISFASCSSDDKDNTGDNGVDATQQVILSNYVKNVIIPTYTSLADAALDLAEDCEDLSSQVKVNKACEDWKAARKYWELSEAFPFGAAADYNSHSFFQSCFLSQFRSSSGCIFTDGCYYIFVVYFSYMQLLSCL